MLSILNDIAARYNLRKSGARLTGPCPECGGSTKSEKFSLYTDGGFRCFSCDFRGDIITWLRKKEGLSCPEAHEKAGVPCRAASCSVRGTCRLGDGSGKRISRQPKAVEPMQKKEAATLPITSVKSPAAIWREWAESLSEKSMPRLQENASALSWLAKRGISSATADRFGLGWLEHDRKVKRDSIGLAPRGGKPELWIPGGLLISIYDDNRIHRLRIRRTDAARGKFLPELKYVWLEGSGNEPLILRPSGKIRGAVIVEAELDAMAVSAAHDQVLAIAIGSVSSGLPSALRAELAALPIILVALDADPDKDGKTGAGPKWIARWQKEFRQAKFWPVPEGKDPGHYAEIGGNLRLWIEAGLVPELPPSTVRHDLPLSPVSVTLGDGGKEIIAETKLGLERIPGLKWCSICGGDKFLHGDAGGYFCVECIPLGKPGRLVLATVPRGAYVVD